MPTHNPKVREVYEKLFKERDITLHAGERVVEVTADEVVTKSVHAKYDALFWVTNASPPAWIAEAGLKTDDAGFVAINPQLQSESHPFVFAAGDVASCAEHPRPKSGVFAVRQGPPLARNLRLACAEEPLEPFRPQQKFLSLITTGEKYAVASRGGFMIQGERIWKWKDWIDRRWMRKYQEMPEMDEKSAQASSKPAPSEPSVIDPFAKPIMHCGGCGSKVGSTVLSRVLKQLNPIKRDDVLVGLDSPDDAAVTETPPGKVAVHTVDFFRSFIKDPYVFGKIAANHALSDIFAMGADPQLALAMAVAPHGEESAIEEQLFQVLSGAIEVMNECGCALGGGHSTEDAQLAFGLAVQGLSDREEILRKGGMNPGEKLILTKPVGTGTLFAADMRQKARGDWITNAIEVMLQLNQEPAKILRRHGATACTDVTGFGLLGHLTEMLKASSVGAEVEIESVPLLDGAAETIEAGILSSLHPENVRIRRAVKDESTASQLKNYPALFDPQTSGGLLASVP
ncbi:MAG: selenide, water dikinase SelD, partial [Verrucomicrobiota bacterium]